MSNEPDGKGGFWVLAGFALLAFAVLAGLALISWAAS